MFIAMATPINSQISLLPESAPRNINYTRTRNRRNKILILKILQFFLACISFTLFILGSTELTNHITDPFVCVIFGICLIFPIFVLSGTTKHASNLMIIFNFLGGSMLLVVGLILSISCGTLYALLEETLEISAEIYNRNHYFIYMKLLSGIFTIINCILYFAESIMTTCYTFDNNGVI